MTIRSPWGWRGGDICFSKSGVSPETSQPSVKYRTCSTDHKRTWKGSGQGQDTRGKTKIRNMGDWGGALEMEWKSRDEQYANADVFIIL